MLINCRLKIWGGAVGLCKKDGKILFALVHDVFWILDPLSKKGKVGGGENIEEGTEREIKKEIGLDIKIEKKLGKMNMLQPSRKGKKFKKKLCIFSGS